MKTKIIIDPLVNIYYVSFYIKGLIDLFGKNNITFSSIPFKNLSNRMMNLNFIVIRDGDERRYSINCDDSYNIKEELYKWCDVYGSVNANFKLTPFHYQEKLISLAPSFGIRLWNKQETYCFLLSNILKLDSKTDKKKFLGKYKRMVKLRVPYSEYYPALYSSNNYVFHLSTLWYNDMWNKNDDNVNKNRANFIRACKSFEKLQFEGGLISQGKKSSEDKFSDCLYNNKVSMDTWIQKTKKSAFVFNTPAFWNCHGWKLGEYLALGKAIISLPLFNDLPNPLVHGKNIHYVENNVEAIKDAIEIITNNEIYKKKLETGAREYWDKYGTPVKSLELLGLVLDYHK